MTHPVLDVRDLTVTLRAEGRAVRALDGVSFSIAPGEVLGLVGESGAGKSLTGRSIAALLPPEARIAAGEIRLCGTRIDDATPAALRRLRGRRIATIVQDTASALDPLRTIGFQVAETVAAHSPLGRRAAAARARAWLERVGLPSPERVADAYPHRLSGGMIQRAVVALALCAEPDVVVADEPTAALDPSLQRQIAGLLRRYGQKRGAAILLITHDLRLVSGAADTLAVMYAGQVVETGPAQAVLATPAHPYTQGLLGSIPPLDHRVPRLRQIDGAMPRLGERPPGCPFAPRCPHTMPRCVAARPPAFATGRGTAAACWLAAPDG